MAGESNQELMAVLKDVVAFVEVRSSNDNRSAAIAHELTQLGARVVSTFSDDVTHVVYKEGLKRTWNRANKRGVPMVSVSWLDSCKQHMRRMPENEFPAILPEESDSPLLRITSRWKKMRSMQPCDFEEEVARSAERGEKRRKRVMMANRFKLCEESTPSSSPVPILALETQPRFLQLSGSTSQSSSPVPDTPLSMKERLARMRREQMNVLHGESPTKTPKVPSEKPLQKRLFERLASDFASTGTSSDDERESTSDVVKQLIQRLDSDGGPKESSDSRKNCFENLTEGLSLKSHGTGDALKIQQNFSSTNLKSNTPAVNRRRSSRLSVGSPACIPEQLLRSSNTDQSENKFLCQDGGREENLNSMKNCSENLTESLSFKPLSPGDRPKMQQNLSTANVKPSRQTVKQNRRHSLRVYSDNVSLLPEQSVCSVKKAHKSDPVAHKTEVQQNGKGNQTSQSPERLSLALSPKDMNILTPLEKSLQADLPPHQNSLVQDCVVTELAHRKHNENSSSKSVQRQKSCRVLSKANASSDKKSTESNLSDAETNKTKSNMSPSRSDLITSKLVKKKRNLYTEPVLDTSLPKPCLSKHTAPESGSTISDVAFLFGTSRKQGGGKQANGKEKKLPTSATGRIEKSSVQKSLFEQSTNGQASNETLGTSMSVMYANDTTCPDESRLGNSRLSIDEFQSSKKLHRNNKSGKVARPVKLDQIEESEQLSTAAGSKSIQLTMNAPTKSKAANTKRNRDSASSCDSVEAESAKRRKCNESESEDQLPSPNQINCVQPRLRHARSLVLEPPQSPSGRRTRYSLVVTSLHREEQELVYTVLKKLGGFCLTNTVELTSTHIVCGEPRRTLNLLKAISRGCWVLSKEWVFKSLEAGAWLKEEDFEMDKEMPVVKRSRLARHQGVYDYRVNLFSSVGPIFVAGECKPPRKELVQLIQLCSGKVTGSESKASLFIGEMGEPGKQVIKPTWILDSIMNLKCLPTVEYVVPAPHTFSQRESSPEF